ncbi:MAG: arsenate reductase ArsC [Bryobacterales bacterium]|nr:arsenate reductase ArsC [Bryobacterales bacterium]
MKKLRIPILCTGNSARSQMAEGLLRAMGERRLDVVSAGTSPSIVRPEAIAVLEEQGIDISGQCSKSDADFTDQPFDLVLTVCDNARKSCPVYPGAKRLIHHLFEDPAQVAGAEEERLVAFHRVRNQIQSYFDAELMPILRTLSREAKAR